MPGGKFGNHGLGRMGKGRGGYLKADKGRLVDGPAPSAAAPSYISSSRPAAPSYISSSRPAGVVRGTPRPNVSTTKPRWKKQSGLRKTGMRKGYLSSASAPPPPAPKPRKPAPKPKKSASSWIRRPKKSAPPKPARTYNSGGNRGTMKVDFGRKGTTRPHQGAQGGGPAPPPGAPPKCGKATFCMVQFSKGPVGLCFEKNVVAKVVSNSQAAVAGVKPGWTVTRVQGNAVNPEATANMYDNVSRMIQREFNTRQTIEVEFEKTSGGCVIM